MLCEHPACSCQADSICKSHCHLSVCEQHRLEHEKTLLNEFQKHLEEFSRPLSALLEQTRLKLKQSQERQQSELNALDSLFNQHSASVDQRVKFAKSTKEFLQAKRQALIQYRNGEQQLRREDYRQAEKLSKEIQMHLQQQYQLNDHILDRNKQISSWTSENRLDKTTTSCEIDCIQLSDSEDESPDNPLENDLPTSDNTIPKAETTGRGYRLNAFRDFCPLTEFGVYGLKTSHNLARLCPKSQNKKRGLYVHFTSYHSIKSPIAYQLTKAIANGRKPKETVIFPQDTTLIAVDNIQCPFDETAKKFNRKNSIPHTPCRALVNYYYFKTHLRIRHSINKTNADLIFGAMLEHGTISHVQFEKELCQSE